MILNPSPDHDLSLEFIEGGLTAIAIALAFCWPRLGNIFFSRIEAGFTQLARRKDLSVAIVGASVLFLRLAILPLCPVPHPFCPDDFSFLLAANTFASGRLTNPTPAMWVHFETMHVTMKPTYMSMYFPAQGLVLAAAKILTGNAWLGIVLTSALMCAAICWMLQAWLPPAWALLGGVIAVLHLGLFSSWVNTYHAAGCITALGGAMVLGALPRLTRSASMRHGILMALGITLLFLSRPYEGMLLCLPVAFMLGTWIMVGKSRPPTMVLVRRAALPLLLIIVAFAWMGYYDYRAFRSPLTLPYQLDRATYAIAPYYVWQAPRPEPAYRHPMMRIFYHKNELDYFDSLHNHFVPQTLAKAIRAVGFFAGFALLPALVMSRRVLLDRRMRFMVLCLLIMMAGLSIEIFFLPHYVACFASVFYALGLQAMRHLRLCKPGDQPVGRTLVRLSVTICVLLAVVRVFAGPLHLNPPKWPATGWFDHWYGPGDYGTERAELEGRLEHLPGKQLIIVRYDFSKHNSLDEWVYNAPDIDHSKVIWAREMGPADNLKLINYYKDRHVWLVQPDTKPVQLSPYPGF